MGNSFNTAKRRLTSLEARLKDDPTTHQKYSEFMQEFLDMGHLEVIPEEEIDIAPAKCNYLPHHCVLKETSTTTKRFSTVQLRLQVVSQN